MSRWYHAAELFFSFPNHGLLDALGFVYTWNRIEGTYILYLEAAILILMILYADRMQARTALRIAALLGCCAVTCIAYVVSFKYGEMGWSAPALVLLLGSAIAAMFKRVNDCEERRRTPLKA